MRTQALRFTPASAAQALNLFLQKLRHPKPPVPIPGVTTGHGCTRRDENNAAVTWNSLDQWHAVDEGGDRYPVIRNCLKLKASCGGRTYVTAVAGGL